MCNILLSTLCGTLCHQWDCKCNVQTYHFSVCTTSRSFLHSNCPNNALGWRKRKQCGWSCGYPVSSTDWRPTTAESPGEWSAYDQVLQKRNKFNYLVCDQPNAVPMDPQRNLGFLNGRLKSVKNHQVINWVRGPSQRQIPPRATTDTRSRLSPNSTSLRELSIRFKKWGALRS